jgi:hypothetical protein
MGHPPTNHDIGCVVASFTLRMHLKGRLSISLVLLVVVLILDGENFLLREKDISVLVLGVPLEEML